MKTIDIREVEEDFELLIHQAAEGHSFIITIDGEPLVQVTPVRGQKKPADKKLAGLSVKEYS